jgi:hypothetical protein
MNPWQLFVKAENALSQALGLAKQRFQAHWQAILHYDPKNLDEDPQFISKHLDAMVSMLLEEQMMLEGDIETGTLRHCIGLNGFVAI